MAERGHRDSSQDSSYQEGAVGELLTRGENPLESGDSDNRGGTRAVMLHDTTLTKLNSTSYLQDNPQSLDAIRYRGIHSKDLQKATQLLSKMGLYASENKLMKHSIKCF